MNGQPPHPSLNGNHRDPSRALESACDAALMSLEPSAEDLLEARGTGVDLAHEIASFEIIIGQLVAERHAAGASASPKLPPALDARLRRLADQAGAPAPIPIRQTPSAPVRRRVFLRDSLVAAACIMFGAALTYLLLDAGRTQDAGPATDPAQFVSMHPNAVRWPWTPTKDSHVVSEVRGEAIFDPTTSKGLLVIEGLAANDPAIEQYQLWIFDATRDERYPVDGGVFDMPGCGRAAVPIEAKLDVSRPTLFAVTVEKPGGVVVSDRRIAILAKP